MKLRWKAVFAAGVGVYCLAYAGLSTAGGYLPPFCDIGVDTPEGPAFEWLPLGFHNPATGSLRLSLILFYYPLLKIDQRVWHNHSRPHADDPIIFGAFKPRTAPDIR